MRERSPLLFFALSITGYSGAQTVRCTTWNLEWFPNGSAKEASAEQQNQRIKEAADVLRHLKSNLITHSDREAETAKNIRKREVAVTQLLAHVRDVIGMRIPTIKGVVIGGDFNTNRDQAMFAAERTLDSLSGAAYTSVFEAIPLTQRITHPGSHGFPDATFDYLFGKNVTMGKETITPTNVFARSQLASAMSIITL